MSVQTWQVKLKEPDTHTVWGDIKKPDTNFCAYWALKMLTLTPNMQI